MSLHLFNRGGGVVYHLRALRYSRREWALFKKEVSEWLEKWNPSNSKNLLLVGPSGGYCFDSNRLKRFDRIVAFDIDSLAPFFFKRNHPDLMVQFKNQCVFSFFKKHQFDSKKISDELFSGEPFSILFSNFLGQTEIVYPPVSQLSGMKHAEWMGRLSEFLKTVSWASFHDRLSGELKPIKVTPFITEVRATVHELLLNYFSPTANGEVIDHSVDSIFSKKDGPFQYLILPLVPGRKAHIIECYKSG